MNYFEVFFSKVWALQDQFLVHHLHSGINKWWRVLFHLLVHLGCSRMVRPQHRWTHQTEDLISHLDHWHRHLRHLHQWVDPESIMFLRYWICCCKLMNIELCRSLWFVNYMWVSRCVSEARGITRKLVVFARVKLC